MKTNAATLHHISHNTLQPITRQASCIEQEELIERSYNSLESFKDELIYACMKQQSIFAAMLMAREINRVNGYKVVSDYDIRVIKKHFSKNEMDQRQKGKNQNCFVINGKTNSGLSKYQKGKSSGYKRENVYKELQKSYMELLSVQI